MSFLKKLLLIKNFKKQNIVPPEQKDCGQEHQNETADELEAEKEVLEAEKAFEAEEESPFKLLFGHLPVKIIGILTLVSLALSLVFRFSEGFSEWYSTTVGRFLRMILAKLTGIFPFSLAEAIAVVAIPLVIYSVVRIITESVKKVEYKKRYEVRFQRVMTFVLLLALTTYNFAYSSCSARVPLEKNLGYSRDGLTSQQLYDCLVIVQDELKACYDQGDIRFTPTGSTASPYSFDELNEKLNGCFAVSSQKYEFLDGFSSKAKPVALSRYMAYTHISGLYSSYTGEVNINLCYPEYVKTFSMAHEMAHQRGMAHEDEANFAAFLVMYESDDVYLRYCALMELFVYLSDALYVESEELFTKALLQCDRRIMYEIFGYVSFVSPYEGNAVGKVTETVNDVSIKLRGNSDGAKSYDMMIELAAAYFGIAD